MKTPKTLKYTESDEWVKIDGNVATIGITDYAQEQLSDIVYVEIAVDNDDSVKKDSIIATLESVKAAADVNSPISGTIVEINEDLGDTPEVVNSDPYEKAWLVKIEMKDPSEVNSLMDAAAYDSYCANRSH